MGREGEKARAVGCGGAEADVVTCGSRAEAAAGTHGTAGMHRGEAPSEEKCTGTYRGAEAVPGAYGGEAVQMVDAALVRLDAQGLVPAVVQQADTGEVLMVAWMNQESLRRTLQTGTTWFWSRSRQELWHKGEQSGNVQAVRRVLLDCDGDTLVVIVDSPGPACHTGHRTCFYRELSPTAALDFEER